MTSADEQPPYVSKPSAKNLKPFRITPDDPRAFKAAVDNALAAFRARKARP